MRKADIFKVGIALVAIQLACVSQASWYWPFGSDEEEKEPPRLSELMEPASLLIDEAADLAAEGKTSESVEKYRAALAKLNQIEADSEREFPGRTKKPEFATLRNKRAYVSAAIDSLLMGQVKSNARAVAVSDTTELEKKLAEEKNPQKPAATNVVKKVEAAKPAKVEEPAKTEKPKAKKATTDFRPRNRRERVMVDIMRGDYAAAKLTIDEMLEAKPNSPAALNLKAVMEIRQDKLKEAEETLDQCIASNPRSYFAYYNMSELMLKKGNRVGAKRYYDTGRAYGGPKNPQLEKLLK